MLHVSLCQKNFDHFNFDSFLSKFLKKKVSFSKKYIWLLVIEKVIKPLSIARVKLSIKGGNQSDSMFSDDH